MKPPCIVAAKANEAMKNLTIASTREFVMISGSPKHAASDKAAPDKGLQPNMLLVPGDTTLARRNALPDSIVLKAL